MAIRKTLVLGSTNVPEELGAGDGLVPYLDPSTATLSELIQALLDYRVIAPEILTIPSSITLPVVSGSLTVGSLLSCTTGTWTGAPTSYTYVWQEDIAGVWTAVAGETSSTYLTTDAGTFRCQVVAVNLTGNSLPASSNSLVISVSSSLATFASVTANGVLSNGNRTLDLSTTGTANCLTSAAILEKTYYEVELSGLGNCAACLYGGVSALTTDHDFGQWYGEPGLTALVEAYKMSAYANYGIAGEEFNSTVTNFAAAQTAPMWIHFAVDPATREVWIRVRSTGEGTAAWGGGGNPATGTTPTLVLSGSDPIFGAATSIGGLSTLLLPGDFQGTAPVGFRSGIAG